jgi:CubicO group peptidase (beta-lactamase class C family)
MRYVSHRACAVVLAACWASWAACGAGETPPGEKGKWSVFSDRLLADLENSGKKPAWPGKTTGVAVDRTTGDAFVLIPGQGAWRTDASGATFARVDGGRIGGRCETGWSINADPGGKRMVCFMLDGPSGFTLDGGKTWSGLADMGRGWDYGAVDWTVDQPKTIFALRHESGGEIYRSADLGKTWKKIGTDPKIEGVGVADAGTLLLHRGRGIERSTDGGPWTKVSDLKPGSRVAVLFEGKVYWVGAAGLIASKDKGKTWEVQGSAVDAAMGPFFGKDDRHAVVVGKKGFFETTDGGKTWKEAAPLPEPECRVDWFGNYAWDPLGDVFYFANMGRPAWRFARAALPSTAGEGTPAGTVVTIAGGRWRIDGALTYRGAPAEGLLMNVRMVNAVFEDPGRPDFDPERNAEEFIARIPDYVSHGVRAFTLNLQGGMPGYEGAANSAFDPDGSLRDPYMRRVERVIEACDRHGAVVILGCFYQRQDQRLEDEGAVRAGVINAVRWIGAHRFGNVALEIANEFGHGGFDHGILKTAAGQAELIHLARATAGGTPPGQLLVSTSGLGHGRIPDEVAAAADFLLIHFNGTPVDAIPARVAALKKFGKPIVCNEDAKVGEEAAKAAAATVASGASWGLMLEKVNQHFPFTFEGAEDDPIVYAKLKELTSPRASAVEGSTSYFPPPESKGGWRKLDRPDDIRRLGGMDPDKLSSLRQWLLDSDDRGFAAVVIRRGHIVLEVERGNSAVTDSRRVASVSKAVCATVLAIASERSRRGLTPKRMTFDDAAFQFIPWAQPLSDPRKARITVKQLLNHTSGICPEATGAPNDGKWEYILGHTGDPRTEKLAFDPGTACGYSSHALHHAALVCETVTGEPYDRFAIEALFKPLGIERWWFQYYDGGEKYGRHPSHGLGMPARDLARIAYCMMRGGLWGEAQVIPKWFVEETAAPTHGVQGQEMRFKLNAQTFSHGWELPALLTGEGGRSGEGIPRDARSKPGSGGQLIAFVPSLDLVVTRQTGSSGEWAFEEYLHRTCAAAIDRN